MVKLKKKINLVKGKEKLKRIRIIIDIKIKIMLWFKGEIEKNNNFYKRTRKKN